MYIHYPLNCGKMFCKSVLCVLDGLWDTHRNVPSAEAYIIDRLFLCSLLHTACHYSRYRAEPDRGWSLWDLRQVKVHLPFHMISHWCLFRKAFDEKPRSEHVDLTNLTECPVCGKQFSSAQIESHAALCDPDFISEPAKPRKRLKPLAKPIYHLLKDAQIRSKLAELRLPIQGTRELLIKRHSEFVLLHNAETDSSNPKSQSTLRNELQRLEKHWKL